MTDPAPRNRNIACLHVATTAVLVTLAAVDGDLPEPDRSWYVDVGTWDDPFLAAPWVNHTNVSDAYYRPRDPDNDNLKTVPVLWLTVVYALWSAGWHGYVWRSGATEIAGTKTRWADYVVSAPIMFVAIVALYGIISPWAILIAPLCIAAMMVIAAIAERNTRKTHSMSVALFVALCLIHCAVWSIVFVVLIRASIDTPDMPDAVPVFTVLTFAAFSSFAYVYYTHNSANANAQPGANTEAIDDRADIKYDVLSAIAKTSLNLFIGLGAIGQSGSLGTDEASAKSMDDSDTLLVGSVGAAVILVAGTCYGAQLLGYCGGGGGAGSSDKIGDSRLALLAMEETRF